MTTPVRYSPDPVFSRLSGPPFADPVRPATFPEAILRYRNECAAATVGLEHLSADAWVDHFARFRPLSDNLPDPLALRYHGHQFRVYNPDLGDGRGFLFAQLRDEKGRLLDLGTKGSGRTPYSRTADGRLTLKGGVREILATEMLEALGVNTSKTFSVIETGEALTRHDEPSPTRACVLVRLSHSHIRFGAFQRLAYEGDAEAIRKLIAYCVAHLESEPDLDPAPAAFFARIVQRTARLGAQWMAAGFVHGVLNTDNMNITGESFDYGPWRFLPAADPLFTAAYFDQHGLYAYGRQAEALAWNLARLGGALSLVAEVDALTEGLARFQEAYQQAMADAFHRRLGLERTHGEDDVVFVRDLLAWLDATRAPFERFFFDWFCGAAGEARAAASPIAALYGGDAFAPLRRQILARAPVRPERLLAPYFAAPAPVTTLIDEVEALWAPIAERDDWRSFAAKLASIAEMRDALAL